MPKKITSWETPIGTARLDLSLRRQELKVAQAKQLADIARDAPADATLEKPTHATAPGDERKLRGIPVQARGVRGAITGTSPHRSIR